MKHLQRKPHALIFMKCTEKSCDHCGNQPPHSKTWQHLHQHGFPTPTSSKLLPSSYQTYLETISDNTCLSDSTKCPSFSSSDPILCDVCPSLMFFSDSSFNRHNLICHMSSASRKRQNHIHLCGVEDCNLSFPTAYQLMKHKKSAGHQSKRG